MSKRKRREHGVRIVDGNMLTVICCYCNFVIVMRCNEYTTTQSDAIHATVTCAVPTTPKDSFLLQSFQDLFDGDIMMRKWIESFKLQLNLATITNCAPDTTWVY